MALAIAMHGPWPQLACSSLAPATGPRSTELTSECARVWWMQHAVGYVTGDQFYGAKASLNVWSAKVASPAEFSLSQIWVISGSFGNDLNTIEAGWQVSYCIQVHLRPTLPPCIRVAKFKCGTSAKLSLHISCSEKMWPSDQQCLFLFRNGELCRRSVEIRFEMEDENRLVSGGASRLPFPARELPVL
jgi:hypothetical protein